MNSLSKSIFFINRSFSKFPSFRAGFDCPNWDGHGQRYHLTYYYSLIIASSQPPIGVCPPPPDRPNRLICLSSCIAATKSLNLIFSNSTNCPGPDVNNVRSEEIGNHNTFCNSIPQTDDPNKCIPAVQIESNRCGFPLQSDFDTYCSKSGNGTALNDPCCSVSVSKGPDKVLVGITVTLAILFLAGSVLLYFYLQRRRNLFVKGIPFTSFNLTGRYPNGFGNGNAASSSNSSFKGPAELKGFKLVSNPDESSRGNTKSMWNSFLPNSFFGYSNNNDTGNNSGQRSRRSTFNPFKQQSHGILNRPFSSRSSRFSPSATQRDFASINSKYASSFNNLNQNNDHNEDSWYPLEEQRQRKPIDSRYNPSDALSPIPETGGAWYNYRNSHSSAYTAFTESHPYHDHPLPLPPRTSRLNTPALHDKRRPDSKLSSRPPKFRPDSYRINGLEEKRYSSSRPDAYREPGHDSLKGPIQKRSSSRPESFQRPARPDSLLHNQSSNAFTKPRRTVKQTRTTTSGRQSLSSSSAASRSLPRSDVTLVDVQEGEEILDISDVDEKEQDIGSSDWVDEIEEVTDVSQGQLYELETALVMKVIYVYKKSKPDELDLKIGDYGTCIYP